MAEQAEVYVINLLPGDINVMRELPDGSSDLNKTIAKGNKEKFPLPNPEVSLVIKAPQGVGTEDCFIKANSAIDLALSCSRTDSNWRIQIDPNNSFAEIPTTVNVNVGENEPEPE